ncbi:MAG TPA: hypothetical protein VFQ22_01075 [Longimicrobiales bacterium]|nr:hypothetical protein [Longimicrobiales bacterium]
MIPSRTWVAAILVAAPACGGDRPEADAAALPAPPDARVTLRIGELDGPLERSFGRVSGVAMDGEGRIYVTDEDAHAVRVFGPDGAYLYSFGGEGEGPGEMLSPCCPGVEGDVLWLRDSGNRRLSAYRLFADSAAYLESRPMAHNSSGLWARTFSEGEVVYDVGDVFDDDQGRTRTLFATGPDRATRVVASVLELDLEQFGGGQTIEVPMDRGVATVFFQTPLGPRHLIAFGPGGRAAEAVGSRYRVMQRSAAGDSAVIDVPGAVGPPLSERERASGEEQLAADAERLGRAGFSLEMSLPDRKPPLAALWFDREGRLWVERSVADGAPREADVYEAGSADASATLVERRRWPPEVRLDPVGGTSVDAALGVARDSLGVEQVVRLGWTEP